MMYTVWLLKSLDDTREHFEDTTQVTLNIKMIHEVSLMIQLDNFDDLTWMNFRVNHHCWYKRSLQWHSLSDWKPYYWSKRTAIPACSKATLWSLTKKSKTDKVNTVKPQKVNYITVNFRPPGPRVPNNTFLGPHLTYHQSYYYVDAQQVCKHGCKVWWKFGTKKKTGPPCPRGQNGPYLGTHLTYVQSTKVNWCPGRLWTFPYLLKKTKDSKHQKRGYKVQVFVLVLRMNHSS
jgi:hypothetical protein